MIKLNPKSLLKILFFVLGFSFLFILIRQVGPDQIIKTALSAKINFLAYGILVYLGLILLRSLKWFLLIGATGIKIKFKKFLPIFLVNCLTGNITPFKSGEMTTPFLFNKYLKIPAGWGFSVIILDRFSELAVFALFFLLNIFYLISTKALNDSFLPVFQAALAFLTLLIIFLIVIIVSQKTALKIFKLFNFLRRLSLLSKILDFAERELQTFYQGLALFKNKKVYKFIIPLTVICWFLELLSFYLVISSVLSAPFWQIATAQLVAISAALITFIPLGIGVGEIGIVFILGSFGYSTALATAGALLVRVFLNGTLLGAGVVGTFLLPGNSSDRKE